jgi:tetratricopeptide repeat protein 21B
MQLYTSYYLEAKKTMADIYLKALNDRQNYARCYKEIVDVYPSLDSFLLLGDAYLNIEEPELAAEVYKSALEVFPKEVSLHGKIGKSLIKTHNYKKVFIKLSIKRLLRITKAQFQNLRKSPLN